jgi:hypothetical protein
VTQIEALEQVERLGLGSGEVVPSVLPPEAVKAGVEIIDGQIILSAGQHDFVISLEGMPKAAQMLTSSFSAAACGRSGFRKWATRVDHLIGCTIDDFATRTREIASGRGVEPPPHIFNVKPSSPRCRQRPAD